MAKNTTNFHSEEAEADMCFKIFACEVLCKVGCWNRMWVSRTQTTLMSARDTEVHRRGCSVVRNGKSTSESHNKSLHNYIHLLHRWLNPFGDADVYSYAITCCEISTGRRKIGFKLGIAARPLNCAQVIEPSVRQWQFKWKLTLLLEWEVGLMKMATLKINMANEV